MAMFRVDGDPAKSALKNLWDEIAEGSYLSSESSENLEKFKNSVFAVDTRNLLFTIDLSESYTEEDRTSSQQYYNTEKGAVVCKGAIQRARRIVSEYLMREGNIEGFASLLRNLLNIFESMEKDADKKLGHKADQATPLLYPGEDGDAPEGCRCVLL